jgi:hypothetical protein
MDIDMIAPGEDFREAIDRTIHSCDVVLVVIGPNWVDARDQAGNRRLDDEGDTHRAELSAALAAPDMRVVPVLVGGASMPKVSDLPERLRDLAYRNAAVIEDRRFVSDVGALQKTLRQFVENRVSGEAGDEGTPSPEIGERHRVDAPSTSGEKAGPEERARNADIPGRPSPSAGSLPTMLVLAGMLLILVWAVLVPRAWHNEVWGVRAGAGVLVLVVAGAGLWTRQWTWVLAAGVAGLAGVVLWMLLLVSTHPSEVNEIASPAADGIPNGVTLVGALLVLAAGLVGVRARLPRANRAGA